VMAILTDIVKRIVAVKPNSITNGILLTYAKSLLLKLWH
jgi:hypothetical protein